MWRAVVAAAVLGPFAFHTVTPSAADPGAAAVSSNPSAAAVKPQEDIINRPPPGFTSGYARVDGFRMHYVKGGHGSPVVLIHGWPQTWAEWREQMPSLARDHTVIAVDLRGTGDSGVPTGGYDTATLARDVHNLMRQLGLGAGVQVVGHDIGLWVAYAYAAQWPNEVRRVAVMEAPIPDRSIYKFPALTSDGTSSEWHFGLFQEPFAETLVNGHEETFVRGFISQFLANRTAFSPAEYAYYARLLRDPRRLRAWFSVYRELRHDVQQNAQFRAKGKLSMPVLAIGGQKALGATVGDQWKKYATRVDTQVLPGSGHWVTEEQPVLLTRLLTDFLASPVRHHSQEQRLGCGR
jgi:pimeloyl-ACP methyl ester carboxylesterase